MKIVDCTTTLSPTLVAWPGDPSFQRNLTATLAVDQVEVSTLVMSAHAGTHIDAPRHFVHGGLGVDNIPLTACIGPVVVIEIPHDVTDIARAHLEPHLPQDTKRVLIKTANTARHLLRESAFTENYTALTADSAVYLRDRGVQLVGIDYLSIERKGTPGHPVHALLLRAGIVIVEGLVLDHVTPGMYTLHALPLAIYDGDGAPARVVLTQP